MKYQLGPREADLIFTLERQGRSHFTVDDARQILATSDEALRVILWRLASKGRIQPVKRGHYLLVPARAGYETRWSEHVFSFIDEMLGDYYVGYWTALGYWQMTEQTPRTVFVASTKRRRNFTYSETVPVKFVSLSSHKFFGWTTESIGDREFRISDREKTVVDSLDLPQHAGGILEVAKGLVQDLDLSRMVAYADMLGNMAVHKRLGYLMDLLRPNPPERVMAALRSSISPGYSWLDPTAPKECLETSTEWRLKVNVDPRRIRSGFA